MRIFRYLNVMKRTDDEREIRKLLESGYEEVEIVEVEEPVKKDNKTAKGK